MNHIVPPARGEGSARPKLTIVKGGKEPELPDDAFSTEYFKARMRGENPDLPLWFGGDDLGPWGGAA